MVVLSPQEAAAAALARGKRGKAKKAQTKYAHQDEEDKALALQLLDPAGRVSTHKHCLRDFSECTGSVKGSGSPEACMHTLGLCVVIIASAAVSGGSDRSSIAWQASRREKQRKRRHGRPKGRRQWKTTCPPHDVRPPLRRS